MVSVTLRFRFSGMDFLTFVSGLSGSGLPPGSPLQRQGVRQADSRTLCLPRRRSDGYPLYCGRSACLPYVIFRFPRNPRKTGANSGFLLVVGLLPYRSRKSPQIPRYGFNGGSQGLPSVGQCRKERKGRKILGVVFCVTCGTSVTGRCTVRPPTAVRCSGSCGRSVPAPGGFPSRGSSSASVSSARWYFRCRH